jgi:uncharacterized repeat protein (TIGR01451 family)
MKRKPNNSKFNLRSLIASVSLGQTTQPKKVSAATYLQRQVGRVALLCSVLAVGAAPAFAEGSRSWYPAVVPAGSNRGSLYNTGGTLLGGTLKTQTVFRVYAQAGEYIMTGSTAVGNGGGTNIRVFDPGTVTGAIGQETLPGTPSFSCNTQRTLNPALGKITSRVQELAGPQTIINPLTGTPGIAVTNGYLPCYYQAPSTGTYFVVFDPFNTTTAATALGDIAMGNAAYFTGAGQGNHISAWDVTVRSSLTSTTNLDGRLFMYYTYIRHGGNPLFANFSLYPVTLDGYRYQTDLRGVDPNAFTIYGNTSGFYDQDGVTPLYHDVLSTDDALTTITGGAKIQRPQFPIFFVPPASNPTLNTILSTLSIPLTATAPVLSALSYQGDVGGSVSSVSIGGTFTYTANVDHTYNLVISRDGVTFDPSNPLNRFLRGVKLSGTNTITWNGKDNQGNNFPAGANYKVQMFIVNGEYHFPLIDAENSPNGGPTLKLLNPPGACRNAGCDLGFYDDRAYALQDGTVIGTFSGTPSTPQVLAGNGSPTITSSGVGGFATSGTQRKFGTAAADGFGDKKGLDIWTYFSSATIETTLDIVTSPATGSPFNCDAKFYQVRTVGATGSAYSQLFQFDRSASPYSQAPISSIPEFVLNGLAFNVQDGFLYATYLGPESDSPTGVTSSFGLYKIGQTGLVSLGAITGLPVGFQPTAADIDQNGKYYLTRAGGSNELYIINITTKTATLVTLSTSTPDLGDLSYNPKDGFLYGVSGNSGVGETLYKINPTTGAVTSVPLTGLTTSGNWGTTYFDVAGTLYAYGNEGAFYQIDLNTGAVTLLSTGTITNRSDGASCVFPPQKLDVVKAAGTPQVVNNKVFNVPYTIKVKNTGTVNVPNIQLTEDLKRTFAIGNPTITLQTAPAVSGAALTLNPNFNVTTGSTTDTRLLVGSDSLATAGLSVITFTVHLVYPSAASVPTSIQNNTVYATSAFAANNPGYSFIGTGNNVPLPPIDLLAGDLSTNTGTLPTNANSDTPIPTPITLPTVTDANVLLVKRITAINGDRTKNPNDNTPLNAVVDDSTASDNNTGWPLPTSGTPAISTFLLGAVDAGKVKPNDTLEYTIYFLNAGGLPAPNVRVCDRLTPNQIFEPNTYGTGSGVQIQLGTSAAQNLTNLSDTSDRTQYITAPTAAPTNCNLTNPANNDGVVLVDITGNTGTGVPNLTSLPSTTAPGSPNDSYGYIRFVTRVKP